MFKRISLAALFATLSFGAFAGPKINTTFFGDKAIEGYDPVAYFTAGKAVEGHRKFSHELHGANWLFSSQQNLDLFRADPDRYLPQYGGYCAYAVGAKNSLAGIDPEAWSIVDGKLYLNYNLKIRDAWDEKQAEYIRQGDINWQTLGQD